MDAISIRSQSEVLLKSFIDSADQIFSSYDEDVIQRRKKTSNNIDARYVCQFTLQLLARQPGGFRGVADRLAETIGMDASRSYSASSICDARRKYPSQLFLDLNKSLLDKFLPNKSKYHWKGKRLFAIDGSKIVLPHGLMKAGFRAEKQSSHYPTGRLSCLYDVKTQLIHDISLNSHGDERRAALGHFSRLRGNDVIIYDRGYFSFKLLAAHKQAGNDFVMRFSEKTGVEELEQFIKQNKKQTSAQRFVEIKPVGTRTIRALTSAFPDVDQQFSVRLIKYTYEDKPYYMITSLLNSENYPPEEFPNLYHSRWGVEEAYKQIKVFLLQKEFHATCYKTVCQEIYASILVANISRALTLPTEIAKSKTKKKPTNPKPTGENQPLASQQIIRLFTINNIRANFISRHHIKGNKMENRDNNKKNKSAWSETTA